MEPSAELNLMTLRSWAETKGQMHNQLNHWSASKIISFIITFFYVNYHVSWYGPPWVHLFGGSLRFLGMDACFLPQISFLPCSLYSFGFPITWMLVHLMMLSSLILSSFFIFTLAWLLFMILSFQIVDLFLYLSSLVLSSVFISVIEFFISD